MKSTKRGIRYRRIEIIEEKRITIHTITLSVLNFRNATYFELPYG